MTYYLLLSLLGLAVGAFGTLIGAGGGFILMPVLLLLYPGQGPAALTAVSLVVVFFNALSGSASYARMGRVDFRSGLLFLAAGLPGSAMGAWAVHWFSRRTFDLTFGVLLLAVSLLLLLRPDKTPRQAARGAARCHRVLLEADGTRHEYAFNLPLGMALSLLVGFTSTLLGIGGGIIHVPAMVHLLDFPVHVATATSHFVLAGMTLVGTVIHVADGTLAGQWPQAASLAGGAVVGAVIGARLSNRIHGRWIMRSLGAALAIVGVRILLRGLGW